MIIKQMGYQKWNEDDREQCKHNADTFHCTVTVFVIGTTSGNTMKMIFIPLIVYLMFLYTINNSECTCTIVSTCMHTSVH